MLNFNQPTYIYSKNVNTELRQQLDAQLKKFYQELEKTVKENTINDFQNWFSERTLLSMFFNAQIRGDANYSKTVVQEYCTTDKVSNKNGRCDGFFKDKTSVTLYEAKFYRHYGPVLANHFDLKSWITWDQTDIRVQLNAYLNCDREFFLQTGRYERCYLTTMVFKIIKEASATFLEKAKNELKEDALEPFGRQWYYSVAFFDEDIVVDKDTYGIEVYGTITDETNQTINNMIDDSVS